MADYAALLGIDWSDRKHDICLIDPATGKREASILPHSPQAIDEWATALRTRYGGQEVAVCLEQSRGPLIYALLKYDFLVLYPVNPRTLARFREAFSGFPFGQPEWGSLLALTPQGRSAGRRVPG